MTSSSALVGALEKGSLHTLKSSSSNPLYAAVHQPLSSSVSSTMSLTPTSSSLLRVGPGAGDGNTLCKPPSVMACAACRGKHRKHTCGVSSAKRGYKKPAEKKPAKPKILRVTPLKASGIIAGEGSYGTRSRRWTARLSAQKKSDLEPLTSCAKAKPNPSKKSITPEVHLEAMREYASTPAPELERLDRMINAQGREVVAMRSGVKEVDESFLVNHALNMLDECYLVVVSCERGGVLPQVFTKAIIQGGEPGYQLLVRAITSIFFECSNDLPCTIAKLSSPPHPASKKGKAGSFSLRNRNAKSGMLSDAKVASELKSPTSSSSPMSLSRTSSDIKRKRSVVKINNIKSKKIGKLAGKSVELKVNPVFERVGDYTKDDERRWIDLRLCLLCLAGILMGILQLELSWEVKTVHNEYDEIGLVFGSVREEPIKMMGYGEPIISEILRFCISVSTIIVVYLRFNLYMYEKARKEALWNNLITLDFIYDKRMFTKWIWESAILIIHPLPFFGPQVWQTCFMFLRSYLIFNLLRDYSAVFRWRKDIVTKVFDKIPSPLFNSFQSVQFQLVKSPIKSLALSAIYLWAVLSYCMYVIEREYMPREFTLRYSMWHTVTVMTTLGYDFTPSTELGKALTVVTAVTGISLETVAVVTILEILALSHYQGLALNFMEKKQSEAAEENAAANYVQECFRWVIYRNQQERLRSTLKGFEHVDSPKLTRQKELASQKKQARKLLEFRQARRLKQLKSHSLGDPTIDRFNSMEIKLFKELRQQSIALDKLKTALGVKRDEFDRGTKINDFMELQTNVLDNKELLKAMAPKQKHFYMQRKKAIEDRKKEREREERKQNAIDEEVEGENELIDDIVRSSSVKESNVSANPKFLTTEVVAREKRSSAQGGKLTLPPLLPEGSKRDLTPEEEEEEKHRKASIMESGFVGTKEEIQAIAMQRRMIELESKMDDLQVMSKKIYELMKQMT